MRRAAIIGLLALAACRQSSAPPHFVLGGARRQAVVSALDAAREAFNRGDCESIYEDASVPFRTLEDRQVWMDDCSHMRAKLGSWISFHMVSGDGQTGFQAHIDGTAIFARGEYKLCTTWTLAAGRARLISLYLQGLGTLVTSPPLRLPQRPLTDPPPNGPKTLT